MPPKKAKPASRPPVFVPASAFERAWEGLRDPKSPPPTVSGRWLLTAASIAIVAAAFCAWSALCLLFWQGSWQLLYHPAMQVTRTPASVGLAFDSVGFATTEAGEPRLSGWWIPASPDARYTRYTVLYMHGQSGNLGNTVDDVAALHGLGLNVLAFDYRGYGQSKFARPSEARWREDAAWALQYLTDTRHVPAGAIILDGKDLGANLALEIAAEHPQLAGVVLESPLDAPVHAIFNDPRARLVPAHLLVRDRFNAAAAARALRIPSLWVMAPPASKDIAGQTNRPAGYDRVPGQKMLVWLNPAPSPTQPFADAYARWLDDLPGKPGNP